jgi:hypothetical protein
MLETTNVKLGDKLIYQLKNMREIHELLRFIKNKYGLVYPDKSYNDVLFNEMLKRETYIVPVYNYSTPILIYMCYYHNNPYVFIISLQSLETIYVLPVIINIEYENILLYGELINGYSPKIYIERVLYINEQITHYYKYIKHIDMINNLNNMIRVDWIIPKPVYLMNEMKKLIEDNKHIIGIRFYSFKNPVIFYKNINDLRGRIVNDIKLLNSKEHWIKKDINIKNTDNNISSVSYDTNHIYDLRINMLSYGIYKVYDNDNKDIGVLRLKTFEEHNELVDYINKYKNIEMKLIYNNIFKKWVIPNGKIKEFIIRGY